MHLVQMGTLRCKRQLDPHSLLHGQIANMTAVQMHPELGPLLASTGGNWPPGTQVRDVPMGRGHVRQLGLVLTKGDASKDDPDVNLHPTMRICIELPNQFQKFRFRGFFIEAV